MSPLAAAKGPAENYLFDDSQLNLAKEAVLVILVVVKDSDLQHLMHIADIPGRLTHSLREHFDSTYNVSYKQNFDSTYKEKVQFQSGSKVFVSVGVLKGGSVII